MKTVYGKELVRHMFICNAKKAATDCLTLRQVKQFENTRLYPLEQSNFIFYVNILEILVDKCTMKKSLILTITPVVLTKTYGAL